MKEPISYCRSRIGVDKLGPLMIIALCASMQSCTQDRLETKNKSEIINARVIRTAFGWGFQIDHPLPIDDQGAYIIDDDKKWERIKNPSTPEHGVPYHIPYDKINGETVIIAYGKLTDMGLSRVEVLSATCSYGNVYITVEYHYVPFLSSIFERAYNHLSSPMRPIAVIGLLGVTKDRVHINITSSNDPVSMSGYSSIDDYTNKISTPYIIPIACDAGNVKHKE